MTHPEVAAKESLGFTQFTPLAPSNPVKPDFISEGKLIDNVTVAAAASVTSKAVQITVNPNEVGIKTLYVYATQAGTFKIQLLMDERERSGGLPVWRDLDASPFPFVTAASRLFQYNTQALLGRQTRIVFTNTGGVDATVDAWIFSVS